AGCSRVPARRESLRQGTPPPAPRPSASGRATPGIAARPARPASAGASPPTRESRRDRASAATGGRGGALRTTPAASLPPARLYAGERRSLDDRDPAGIPKRGRGAGGDPARRLPRRVRPHLPAGALPVPDGRRPGAL